MIFYAVFTVHKDMRIHTGGFMAMGTGRAYIRYSKKNKYKEFNIGRTC